MCYKGVDISSECAVCYTEIWFLLARWKDVSGGELCSECFRTMNPIMIRSKGYRFVHGTQLADYPTDRVFLLQLSQPRKRAR